MINKKIVSSFIFISSLVLPVFGIAAEDIALSTDQLHARTVAASCAACHGTDGRAVAGNAVLAGMDKTYFTTQMLAFKNGSRSATVMHHHAKGLNEDEINLLALYFSQQKRSISQAPKPQTLKASHE